ncbi:MAG: DUF92 domain-containing protein [Anaerolineales bacterium]
MILAFLLALLISLLAWRFRALTVNGALAATVVGSLIFGLGGWRWALLLLLFFFTSSALTRAFVHRKRKLSEKFAKGGQRDAMQVMANGGVAALCVLAHFAFPQALWSWLGFAASLAAVNADTWATELGVLSPHPPRRITNWQIVEEGASGGITLLGTSAALLGSALIALPAAFLPPLPISHPLLTFVLVTLAGLIGSLIDSLLGDTLQAIYFCPRCRKETEHFPRHSCGTATSRLRGLPWLDNDGVNIACALSAALLALAFALLFG